MSILTNIKNAITKDKTKTISSITKVKGIDVSSYQGDIDWQRVSKTDIKFAILRSTIKNGELDSKFEQNYKEAKKYNLDVDVYHFSYALDTQKAINDAKNLINKLNGKKVVIWLDLEWASQGKLGKDKVTEIAISFIKTCNLLNYECNIYSNLDWYKNYYHADKLKNIGCKFWIARYGKNEGILDETYKPNVGEYIWQYTSKGFVQGIKGDVDINMKYITESNPINIIQKLIRITCENGVNIRTTPDSSNLNNRVGIYKYNSIVEVIGITKDNNWYKDINGDYITANKKWVNDLIGIVYNCYKLNLRSTNNTSGKIINVLDKDDKLYLLKKSNGWYYVQTSKGEKGWVHGNYVKII